MHFNGEPVQPGNTSVATTAGGEVATEGVEPSLGELFSAASRDMSALVKQEIALAKAEMAGEAKQAGIGAGMLAVAGLLGLLALILLSFAAVYGLHALGLPLGLAFLAVGVAYVLIAGILALLAKGRLSKLGPPQRTIKTLKDDLAWAKHPTAVPTPETSGPTPEAKSPTADVKAPAA